MITPSFGLTATERVLPQLALDWTTGLAQPGVDVTRSGVATFVGSNGLIQSASADTQRIDYSTGIAGLLVEETRTNVVDNSEDFSGWATQVNVLITPNAETAPDGATTASKYTLTFSTGRQVTSPSFPTVVGVTYTLTLYIKAIVTTTITFDGTTTGIFVADGWKRLTKTFVADSTSKTFYMFDISGGVGDRFYFWGFQVETGAFATSYIPTEATAVTRNADVATMTGTNFSDWFNPTEGTFVVSASADRTFIKTDGILSAHPDSVQDRISISTAGATNDVAGSVRVGNVGQAYLQVNNSLSANPSTFALSYKTDKFQFAANGSASINDTSGSLPTVDRLSIGALRATTAWLNGHIQAVRFYPQALTAAEIQAFSKG